jgi:hypothetical protein
MTSCPDTGERTTAVRTGTFWKSFGPGSRSPGSFGLTPLTARSIPNEPFWKIELKRIFALAPVSIGDPPTTTPELRLNAITLPAPSSPTPVPAVLAETIWTPTAFGRGRPIVLVPIRFPSTRFPVATPSMPTPGPPLPEMRLPEAGGPPITLFATSALPSGELIHTP